MQHGNIKIKTTKKKHFFEVSCMQRGNIKLKTIEIKRFFEVSDAIAFLFKEIV